MPTAVNYFIAHGTAYFLVSSLAIYVHEDYTSQQHNESQEGVHKLLDSAIS